MQRAVNSLLSLLKLASTVSGACARVRLALQASPGINIVTLIHIDFSRFKAPRGHVTLALHSFIARLAQVVLIVMRFVFCDLCLVSPLRVATYAIETWRSGSTLFVTYLDVVGLPISRALLKVFYHPE